jgi:hypothetical protein
VLSDVVLLLDQLVKGRLIEVVIRAKAQDGVLARRSFRLSATPINAPPRENSSMATQLDFCPF